MEFLLFPEIGETNQAQSLTNRKPDVQTDTNPVLSHDNQSQKIDATRPLINQRKGITTAQDPNKTLPPNPPKVLTHVESEVEDGATGHNKRKSQTYKEVLAGIQEGSSSWQKCRHDWQQVCPLKPLAVPRVEAGNVVIEIGEEDYEQGVEDLKFSVIGTVALHRGDSPPTIKKLREKFENAWQKKDFRIIPMDNGVFHILLFNADDQSIALTFGAILLEPGIIHFNRWMPGIDYTARKQTSTQTWVRLYKLGLEYRKPQVLFDVASGVGIPLMIDPKTADFEMGIYARILVEVDLTQRLPDRVLVKRKDKDNRIKEDFFVEIHYEKLPKFCNVCCNIGHLQEDCWKLSNPLDRKPENRKRVPQRNTGWQTVSKRGKSIPAMDDVAKELNSGPHREDRRNESTHQEHTQKEAGDEMATAVNVDNASTQVGNRWQSISKDNENSNTTNAEKMQESSDNSASGAADLVRQQGTDAEGIPKESGPTSELATKHAHVHDNDSSAGTSGNKEDNAAFAHTGADTEESSMGPEVANTHSLLQQTTSTRRNTSTRGNWGDMEDAANSTTNSYPHKMKAGNMVIEAQLDNMNIDVIYWIADEEIYIHASGMCYEPNAKVFFKKIDPLNGDDTIIYYVHRNGDLFPAKNGDYGRLNKSVFGELTWDNSKLYSVKTKNYRAGLHRLFKEKVVEMSFGL